MSSIPNSAMPHAKVHDDAGSQPSRSGADQLARLQSWGSERATQLREWVRAEPRTAALLAAGVVAVALPLLRRA